MKTTINSTIKSLSIASLLFTSAMAESIQNVDYENSINNNEADIPMISTSKDHNMSRLLTMQTAQTLDSYSLAFSGSGNIHQILSNFGKDGLEGSLILGLGNVVDIGYELSEFYSTDQSKNNRSEGSIKLNAMEEDAFIPAFSVGYSQTLNKNYETENGVTYQLEAAKYLAMISKTVNFSKFELGIHGTIEGLQYKFLKYNDNKVENVNSYETQPQLGITWQKGDGNLFILENKLVRILNTDNLVSEELNFESGLETNFAVRFHLQTWLLFDAGIRNLYNTETETNRTQIHANISGIIPLASLGNRISSMF